MHETNRLRTEGTKSLIEAAKASGVARILTQSIAFAYVPQGARPATEHEQLFTHAPKGFASVIEAVAESERLTSETPGLEGTVLRYGFFYGPGTVYSRGGSFAIDVSRRRVPIIGSGSGVFSFIHVRDAAIATIAALKHLATGTYNIVDDEPVPVRTWLPEYARLLGAPAPRNAPRWLGRLVGGPYADYLMVQQRGASNAKARADLNWRPQYARWHEGFESELVGR